MKKKIIIISTILLLVIVGIIVGISCYRNTPEYVMKQYKKAYDTKDQELLKAITCTFDQLELLNIKELDDKGITTNVISYEMKTKPTDNPETIQKLQMLYKSQLGISNKEYKEFTVSKVARYMVKYNTTSSLENAYTGETEEILYLGLVNNKWKIVFSYDTR